MVELDRRTYDVLRVIREHEPIGSIRLTDVLHQHGYAIQDRTIRLLLSNLDEAGLTEKVPGRGRYLTEAGHRELQRGNLSGRLERVRDRIAVLTSQVTYDPVDDVGDVVSTSVEVPRSALEEAIDLLERLSASALGPVPTAVDAADDTDESVQLYFPSSITLGGVLLTRGIDATLESAGLVQYDPTLDPTDDQPGKNPRLVRYVDAINGEGSSMDVVSLLIEAGRTDVASAVDGREATLIVDNRRFPIVRLEETLDILAATRDNLGGVSDIRRPRETGAYPQDSLSFDTASLTYGGTGELAASLLAEAGLTDSWTTLHGLTERAAFRPPVEGRLGDAARPDGDVEE